MFWRREVQIKVLAKPFSLWSLRGRILPCLFLPLMVASSYWYSWACSCITPISTCCHMALSLSLSKLSSYKDSSVSSS